MAPPFLEKIMPLSPLDKKRLRRIGHHLKPVLLSGDKGLSDAFLEELQARLEDHELIKVKVNAPTRDERARMIEAMCEHSGAEQVQRVGNIALLYRAAAEPNPKLSNILRFQDQ
tara:strand:+ start:249 stop:590 length:342 start_codon:yes stop_codon:yes gene_type:complete